MTRLYSERVYTSRGLTRENHEAEARRFFEQAIRLDPYSGYAVAAYAEAMSDWGNFDEAEILFRKAIRSDETCVLYIRRYGRSLLMEHNPEAENNMIRAIALFERAVALDPRDAESHFALGYVLSGVDGEEQRDPII